jgi:hypothetical protein
MGENTKQDAPNVRKERIGFVFGLIKEGLVGIGAGYVTVREMVFNFVEIF